MERAMPCSMHIRDEDKKTFYVISVLPDLKRVAPRLETLSFSLSKWTEEPDVGFLSDPRLRKLKIVYDEDFRQRSVVSCTKARPDIDYHGQYTILSIGIGAQLLWHMLKYLPIFQLYNPLYSPPPTPAVELTAVSPVYGLLPSARAFLLQRYPCYWQEQKPFI
ncbi:hypothetical protein APHAL10511_003250 [Amanita phalloides]|nr:hypothetical protein APHAL10511_003250 [Amanita phalloides]